MKPMSLNLLIIHQKYGLGYLLADGTVGLVFKDSTRLTLSPDALYIAVINNS